MKNSISNGNGDSRYMKSAIPEDITHEELVALLRDGRFPFDFHGINKDGFVQLGQALTKENLLDDNTEATIWGDIADRTVNQALLKLALSVYAGEGMVVNVTVKNDAGEPFEGVTIGGLFDSSANTMVTDAEGKATGYTVSTSATLSVTGFFDLEDSTVTVTGDRGSTQNVTITMERRNFLSVTSTQSRMFSPFCKRVDVAAVGGGGGGASAYYSTTQYQGQGGAGGNVTVKENVAFEPMTKYTPVIGAGGATGSFSGGVISTCNGKAGGTTAFLGVEATGGGGGIPVANGATTMNTNGNGSGGGSATAGGAGTQSGYISFTETGLLGGGGGGGSNSKDTVAAGGNPYGGDGARIFGLSGVIHSQVAAQAGNGPGGGGGGGAWSHDGDTPRVTGGAKGAAGAVNIRMWFEEDLAA